MSELAVKTIRRQDYKPSGFIVDSINLCFDLFDEHAIVTNLMTITNLDVGQSLFLNGESLELVSILMDDKLLDYSLFETNDEGLTINQTPNEFTLEIVTKIFPQKNTQLSGLYRSHALFCTQCEAQGFRRISYFLDRSDVLSTYSTKIIANKEKYPVLLSNGNLIDKGDIDENRHWVLWQDPFKKPCYLFALVAGNLECIDDHYITQSKRRVVLKIFVEKGNEDKCHHAMVSLKKSMAWDEKVYGCEYDLGIFMIVAVSDFNMGAMENKGLNIFNTKYILADERSATDDDFAGIEGVVAHEYFHNWTGNRITCRDWFQLSLKEGLTVFRDQEFSRDMNSRSVNRIGDVKVLRAHQFPEDAGPMAHPVRPEAYIEINNFYTSTIYNKGAEVIRMQHTLLGERGYRKGMDLYFDRHDGQAVTINDFVASMEDANDIDWTQLKRWYSQAGTPEVKARVTIKEGTLTLKLNQYCRPTPGQEEKLPFYMPIKFSIFSKEGKAYELKDELIILKEEKQEFTFENIDDGAIISLLRDFSAPIILSFNQSDDDLLVLIKHETDGFARFEAMQKFQRRQLHSIMKQDSNDETMTLNDSVGQLFHTLLTQENMDTALKAELLQPLDFESIINGLKDVDVQAVLRARDFYVEHIADVCHEPMLSAYQFLHQQTISQTKNEKIIGQRKLKNVLLSYLRKQDEHIHLLQSQFNDALNMTDEIAAYKLLVNCRGEVAEHANTCFYAKWSSQELVLDKWFAVQAMAKHDGVINDVNKLMMHTDFSLNNPNKVRALISSFSMANPRYFHTKAGYELLEKVILDLDAINPQTAARLVTPFTRWRRYSESLQALMKASLERILSQDKLSKDTFEIVSKSLEE